jgi:hypothetical protein
MTKELKKIAKTVNYDYQGHDFQGQNEKGAVKGFGGIARGGSTPAPTPAIDNDTDYRGGINRGN